MKRILAFTVCLFLLSLTACAPAVSTVDLDMNAVLGNYAAVYDISTVSGDTALTYSLLLTVIKSRDSLRYTGAAKEPFSGVVNGETVEGTQWISMDITLSPDNGSPLTAEESFRNTAIESQYTAYTCTFDHDAGYAMLKTTVYDKSSETGLKEQAYTISLGEQYFEKDTLPFLLAGFPDGDHTIAVAAGNRDKLQSIRVEQAEDESLTVPAGTFDCRVFVLRPATVFAVTSARVWIDRATGMVVQVEQEQSRMTLSSFEGV